MGLFNKKDEEDQDDSDEEEKEETDDDETYQADITCNNCGSEETFDNIPFGILVKDYLLQHPVICSSCGCPLTKN